MNYLNKLNPEWIPLAYKATDAGNVRPVKTGNGQGHQSIKPLVRHTLEHSKKKTSGR